MLKRLVENISTNNLKSTHSLTSNPMLENDKYLRQLSKHALKLFERKKDIEKFTKLAISEPNDEYDEQQLEKLLKQGLIPASLIVEDVEDVEDLAENEEFWDDIDFDDDIEIIE